MEINIGEGGIDWPAWVQAVGSVIAILVSAGFSLWVPLHLRSIEGRTQALYSQRMLTTAILLLSGTLDGIQTAAINGEIHDNSAPLVDVNLRNVRILLDGLPRQSLAPEAIQIVADIDAKTFVLAVLLASAREADVGAVKQLPFLEVSEDLAASLARVEQMLPVKEGGLWHLAPPHTLELA